MVVLLATVFGLVVWIVTWAIGLKSVDGFLIGLGIVVVAAAVQQLLPVLLGKPDEL